MFDHQTFLQSVGSLPGVYRMLDAEGRVLYVGKARNLRQRLASYFRTQRQAPKTQRLVVQIHAIEVTVTHTEVEALLLESTLIKSLQPRYNILLRDDKTYPYLHISAERFPRLSLRRGNKRGGGRYFGPYPQASAARETLDLLQKIFRLRSCEDTEFAHRSRPCLQYQMQRCTAPCVGKVGAPSYQAQITDVLHFLEGGGAALLDDLAQRMNSCAAALQFEAAARYRDQISALRQLQQRQYVEGESADIDVLACASAEGVACVQVFMFRHGRLLGNRGYFPKLPQSATPEAILSAFLLQYYLDKPVPSAVLLTHRPLQLPLVSAALQQQAGRRIALKLQARGAEVHWLEMALRNAEQELAARLNSKASRQRRWQALRELLGLQRDIARIECFDVSHTQGTAPVAACVVFDADGACRTAYRRYYIEGITPGDDYAALHQALMRRYSKLCAKRQSLPEVLLIDGGVGQLARALAVLEALQISDVIALGIAKGGERRPGCETLHLAGQSAPLQLPPHAPALHLLQEVRDEAHRFAITGHRQRRTQQRKVSALNQITGIGAQRRQALLRHFGGVKQVAQAGIEDLTQVAGISAVLAQRIYDAFHQ